MIPWHGKLVSEWFARGSTARLEDVADAVGQSLQTCERALKTPWCQAEIARYQAAVRKHLAQRRVAPLEELQQWGHEAARGLVAALWLATERENIREMRESSSAILNYLGHTPVKRTDKTVTHRVDAIHDPAVLARVIETGELPDELMLPPP